MGYIRVITHLLSIDPNFLGHPSRSNHEIFTIPGVSSRMVRADGLHVLFTKGILAHLLGPKDYVFRRW